MFVPGDTDALRLIFAEADNLPGIVADRYASLVVVQLLTQGTAQDDVRELLHAELAVEGVQTMVERPDARIRELESLLAPSQAPLFQASAEPALQATFLLNGLALHFDADSGQKTGAFLDQRLNYAAAARHAHGRALDVCTYQGGFALHMARTCDYVTGVDASRAALEVAERNLQRNRSQLAAEVDWIEADAFDLLRDMDARGERWDTVVLDPPAFAKTQRAAEGALRGYKELNLRALRMLRPGGTLVTCSCSHHISLEDFTSMLGSAAADAQRHLRLLETRGAAPDHPEVLTLPETRYLKCLIAQAD
jgi:23S rRNA (cytosine1962-C5)-methyltransferase